MTELKTQKDSPLPEDIQDDTPEERTRFDGDMKKKMEENFRDTRTDLENVDANVVALETIHASRVRVTKNDAQSIPYNTYEIIKYDDVVFDNLGEYDNTTWKFTGQNAGYYRVTAAFSMASTAWTAGKALILVVYKNASTYTRIFYENIAAGITTIRQGRGSTLVYLNGTTDYVQVRVYQNASSGAKNSYTSVLMNYLEIERVN